MAVDIRLLPPRGPIARATLRTTLVLSLRLMLQSITLVVLARVLDPAGFGSYIAIGALAVLLGTLASFGTHLTLLRDVARDPISRDDSLRLALGTTMLCGTGLLGVYSLLCALWLKPAEAGPEVIACIGIAEFLMQPTFVLAAMERHARGQIARSQFLLTLPLALRLSAALLVGWIKPADPLTTFAAGHLLSVALALTVAVAFAPVPWPRPRRWRLPRWPEWRDASGYAFLSASASGMSELDKMLAAKLLSAGTAGVYAAASRVIGALVLPVIAMMVSAMPRLLRESERDGRRLQRWLFACAASYGATAGLGVWLLAPWLQPLFGSHYAGMAEIMRWLAWAVPAISLRAAASNVLTSVDLPWLRARLELSGWLMIATLAWALSRAMGAHGLALSVVCTEWLAACACWGAVWLSQTKKSEPLGRQ